MVTRSDNLINHESVKGFRKRKSLARKSPSQLIKQVPKSKSPPATSGFEKEAIIGELSDFINKIGNQDT